MRIKKLVTKLRSGIVSKDTKGRSFLTKYSVTYRKTPKGLQIKSIRNKETGFIRRFGKNIGNQYGHQLAHTSYPYKIQQEIIFGRNRQIEHLHSSKDNRIFLNRLNKLRKDYGLTHITRESFDTTVKYSKDTGLSDYQIRESLISGTMTTSFAYANPKYVRTTIESLKQTLHDLETGFIEVEDNTYGLNNENCIYYMKRLIAYCEANINNIPGYEIVPICITNGGSREDLEESWAESFREMFMIVQNSIGYIDPVEDRRK